MSRLIVTEGAALGLKRCKEFLEAKNPMAMQRAGQVIQHHLSLLEASPNMGRPLEELPELRELIIPFGDSGYVALYRHEERNSSVVVLAFRHQKEAGY